MKKIKYLLLIMVSMLLLLTGCGSTSDSVNNAINETTGKTTLNLNLKPAFNAGYNIDTVEVQLHNNATGATVTQNLSVNSDSQIAGGTIGGLAVGDWEITVDLKQGGTVVGTGEGNVTVQAGQTASAYIEISLSSGQTGSVEITVIWGDNASDIPEAPTNLSYYVDGNGDLILTWDAMAGATGYNIYAAWEDDYYGFDGWYSLGSVTSNAVNLGNYSEIATGNVGYVLYLGVSSYNSYGESEYLTYIMFDFTGASAKISSVKSVKDIKTMGKLSTKAGKISNSIQLNNK